MGDPIYGLALNNGDYLGLFRLVADDLGIRAEDQSHFKIIEGYSRHHDDRIGQANPVTLQISLDPKLFKEGREGLCQGVVHEWTHLKQFRRDREQLHAFFSVPSVPQEGWKGCSPEDLEELSAKAAEADAYECLQDNALVSHAAAMDIEAVLAQLPYAAQKTLRPDDLEYLKQNVIRWVDHLSTVLDHSNESYYLAEIKKEDTRIFCAGFKEAARQASPVRSAQSTWDTYCSR